MTRENDAAAVAGDGAMVGPACAMVIFGAAGDLTKRLVVPALYDLSAPNVCPSGFSSSASIWRRRRRRTGARA
jgi:glucose-6-phosphate 1-dehydrogenase